MSLTSNEIRHGKIAARVLTECARQYARFGEQNHPPGTSARYARAEARAKRIYKAAAEAGNLTYLDILREEVLEAFACEIPTGPGREAATRRLIAELEQVAAVAISWIGCLERSIERGGK